MLSHNILLLQTCISANRVLVQAGVYDEFLAALKEAVEKSVVGDGLKEGVNIGPLINANQLKRVRMYSLLLIIYPKL